MQLNIYKELLIRYQDSQQKDLSMLKQNLSQRGYWTEFGGNFVTSNRQTGKTTALCNFAKALKQIDTHSEVVIVAPYRVMCELINQRLNDNNFLIILAQDCDSYRGLDYSNTHLLIDEFNLLKEEDKVVLDFPWKSVSGVGT